MNQNILNEYQIKETIGKGTFSKVKLGINKSTGEKVAIKILDKRKIKTNSDRIRVQRELTILKKINHINIVKIIQTKEDQENVYIVMEFIDYDLFLHIVNNKRLDEKESALYYFQLISGLEYIHLLNIVHRDLKPENLLLTKRRVLKIIDFGLSNFFFGEELLVTPCGSPSYTPPEMIKGYKYNGFAVDIWTTGIILYGMLCGYLPFEEKDTKALFKKIIKCKVIYPKYVSNNAQSLLRRILVPNPDKRITISEIKKHPFYLEGKDIFYKRYPDLVDKLENGNSNKLNKNYSFNTSLNSNINPQNEINDISIKNFSTSEKKRNIISVNNEDNYNYYKKLKEKSSSPYSLYKKHLKNKANFELLKRILRGSRTDSLERDINPLMKEENENEEERKMKLKGEENMDLKTNYSPIQLIRRLNNQRQKYEKKSQMTEFKDKNEFYKQKMIKENNYDTLDYEDEKNNNLNNGNQRMSKTNTFNLNNNEVYNKKRNSKDNNFMLMNNRMKYINYNSSVKDEEKNISSNNFYRDYNKYNNNNFKFKFNNNKFTFLINGSNDSGSEYYDSFNEYNKNNSRIKSYIINSTINDNKSTNNKSITAKPKKTKSPTHSKYSGLSEKIISFNNLYNSIQNKIESYRENHERKNKFDKIKELNKENANKANSIGKRNIKKNGKKNNRIKLNIKSAEHRKRPKNIKQENNLKYSPSDLNKRLKSLKNSKNNSKSNVRSLENCTSKKQLINIKNGNSVSKRNKNTEKFFKKRNNNQKKINPIDIGGKKYDIQEIIKRRGLNKNYTTENNKY